MLLGDKNKFIDLTNNQQLHADENNLSFTFTHTNKSSMNAYQYAYMLEGFDKNWIELDQIEHINYNNLKPGSYKLKIKKH